MKVLMKTTNGMVLECTLTIQEPYTKVTTKIVNVMDKVSINLRMVMSTKVYLMRCVVSFV